MSNCVNIYTDIVIPKNQLCVDELLKACNNVNNLNDPPKDFDGTIMWWFLGSDNIFVEGDQVVIRLGNHRSGHTWRDLRQTAHVLSKFVDPDVDGTIICPIDVSDEFDCHETIGRYLLELKPLT